MFAAVFSQLHCDIITGTDPVSFCCLGNCMLSPASDELPHTQKNHWKGVFAEGGGLWVMFICFQMFSSCVICILRVDLNFSELSTKEESESGKTSGAGLCDKWCPSIRLAS